MKGNWIALLLAVCAACGPPPSTHLYAEEPDPRTLEYVVGPADELGVNVWGVENLTRTVRVRPDGAITLPLIGDVRAGGRTPSELRAEIQKRLRTYVSDPSAVVSVVVLDVNSYRVTVLGRVGQPGVLESDHYLTVSEAIALAGGPTLFAKPKGVLLTRRRPDGSVVRIPIRYDRVVAGRSPEQDLMLLCDDQLYMP